MQLRKVRALKDAYGHDITGDIVIMAKDTVHIIRASDIEYFQARPTQFLLFSDAEIATYAFDVNGVDIGFYAPDGSVRLYSTFSSITSINGVLPAADRTLTLTEDSILDGTINKKYTLVEKVKLATIATGATVNLPDANLLARANHTGEQVIGTVTGLTQALADKLPLIAPANSIVANTSSTPAGLGYLTISTDFNVTGGALRVNFPATGGGTTVSSGVGAAPLFVRNAQVSTVPTDTQMLFRKRIKFEGTGRLVFGANSILVQI